MMQKTPTIFRRFTIYIFGILVVQGIVFVIITYLATVYYHEASTQLLNKDIAAHIVKFTSPFTENGLNTKKADSVFKNAMILSPGAEVYFLDPTGKVVYFDASKEEIKKWTVSLAPINKFIAKSGKKFIKGIDPKEPGESKIFSAANVIDKGQTGGYIYVILKSKKSENIVALLFGSHIISLAGKAFLVIILLSLIFGYIHLSNIRKNFQKMFLVLNSFESGDYTARFSSKQGDELEPVTRAFNKMADLLVSAIQKLTKAEVERKKFIAAISHDLRTPLTIATGFAETLLLEKQKGLVKHEEQEQYIQLIYSKLTWMENLVNQLFEVSKMEAVEFIPHKEPLVLSETIEESANTFQLIAEEKNISLVCNCHRHVWVNADVSMMERVAQNLIGNALKYTPEGGWVAISVIEENNMVLFKIENEAPPLPESLSAWINSRSKQDNLWLNRPSDSGLGLVIVIKILQLHDAKLHTSVSGNKNVFSFHLPAYKAID